MDWSMSGFSVHHYLPEFAQTHVLWVGDVIKPSHPLSPPSLALNLSQHQGLFQWVSSSHQVAKVLELQLQHQSFQWIFRVDFLKEEGIFIILQLSTEHFPAQIRSDQSLSRVRLFATPWIAAHQASLSISNSWSLLKLMSLSWWCHPTISSSVIPFSSCPQSFPASESFPMSQLFAWGGQSIGVSALASFLPKKS